MAAWSSLGLRIISGRNTAGSLITGLKNGFNVKVPKTIQVRCSHDDHKIFSIRLSDFEFKRSKNLLHFWGCMGLIPIVLVITYVNIFIGDAQLALIPEGYEPKPWEYHKHPISRFIARYILKSPQEIHERNLHNIFEIREKQMLTQLENKVANLIKERQDYKAWYVIVPDTYYPRKTQQISRERHADDRTRGSTGLMF